MIDALQTPSTCRPLSIHVVRFSSHLLAPPASRLAVFSHARSACLLAVRSTLESPTGHIASDELHRHTHQLFIVHSHSEHDPTLPLIPLLVLAQSSGEGKQRASNPPPRSEAR